MQYTSAGAHQRLGRPKAAGFKGAADHPQLTGSRYGANICTMPKMQIEGLEGVIDACTPSEEDSAGSVSASRLRQARGEEGSTVRLPPAPVDLLAAREREIRQAIGFCVMYYGREPGAALVNFWRDLPVREKP